jgi:hypothetical protein
VKKELEETKSLKHKLEVKEADIKVICMLQYSVLIILSRGRVGSRNKHITWLFIFILFSTDMLDHDLCKLGCD